MNKKRYLLYLVLGLIIISGCAKSSRSTNKDSADYVTSETDFQLTDINGESFNVSDYKGKPLVVKFWASWCPICLAGLDEIEEISADKTKNYELITVASPEYKNEKAKDDFIEWYKTLEADKSTVLLDNKGELAKTLSVRVEPTFVYYDANGEIVKTIPGQADKTTIQKNVDDL